MKHALIKGERSDEWYTPEWCVQQIFEYYKPKGKILLPWDTDKSNFVKYCRNNNIEHIYNIKDFMTNNYECDWIISNPPYSNKDEIIERCVEIGKPTVLLLPIESLGGLRRHNVYRRTKLDIYIPERRIAFISENGDTSKSAAHHSIYLGLNFEEQRIELE